MPGVLVWQDNDFPAHGVLNPLDAARLAWLPTLNLQGVLEQSYGLVVRVISRAADHSVTCCNLRKDETAKLIFGSS
jgi:hypothetical protein